MSSPKQGRLVLIEPKAPNLHIFSGMSLPRLGTILLGTLAERMGWDVTVIIEEQAAVDWELAASADVVGISTITSTAPRAYAMADRFRELDIPVILGGPHVTFLPDEGIQHADFVMRGEAESTFPQFLKQIMGSRDWSAIPRLSWRAKDGTIVHNKLAPSSVDLDELPTPDFSLVRGRSLKMGGKMIIPVQTSRGCPYDCSFCSVTGMFGRRFRFRSTETILAELDRYDERSNYIFFYDDNFMASRRHALELLDAMAQRRYKFRWSAQVRADLARDEDLVRKMRLAGCHTVFIGFESVNPAALKSMKKGESVDDLARAAKRFRKNGIHVHGMFILGLDDDNPDTVRETVRFARRNLISTAQFLVLAPLPGTRQFEELQRDDRIAFDDWSLYDAHHVVYKPKQFSIASLQKAQISAHRSFYSLRETVRRLARFQLGDVAIAHYARLLNRSWKRRNKTWLKLLALLDPKRGLEIQARVRQVIDLDRPIRRLLQQEDKQSVNA
jgi:radical SAM superfamily enzyme YgiQ (UPF0313 family)